MLHLRDGVFPLSQHFAKNTGKSVLAKWELGTGKVQRENKRIQLQVGYSLFSNKREKTIYGITVYTH